jgi:hypothetical protein
MKILLPIIVFTVSLLTISFSTNKLKKQVSNNQDGFALVELFTSEGCSSCPPADAILEEIQKNYSDKNVVILGYHVDYWDKLGWKDVFSKAEFTERQNYYADIFRLNSIYTPQVVVNGKKEFIGSNKNKLISSIDEQLEEKSSMSIKLNAIQNISGKIEVNYSTDDDNSKDDQLTLLLVQKVANNKISRGENEGRTLHHINIVREISYLHLTSDEMTTTFTLLTDLKKEDVFVAGFIQDKKSGKVTAISSSQID